MQRQRLHHIRESVTIKICLNQSVLRNIALAKILPCRPRSYVAQSSSPVQCKDILISHSAQEESSIYYIQLIRCSRYRHRTAPVWLRSAPVQLMSPLHSDVIISTSSSTSCRISGVGDLFIVVPLPSHLCADVFGDRGQLVSV